jgi:hypothetical protein
LDCRRSVYNPAFLIKQNYSNSYLSKDNRDVISRWVNDSRENGYDLIFSLIPNKSGSNENYENVKMYIDKIGGKVFDFSEYITDHLLQPNQIYYKYDGHFNEAGNEYYSRFLQEIIENF